MKEAGELPSESGEAHSRQREQLELKILRCSACSKNSKRTACSSEVSGRGMGLPEDKVKELRWGASHVGLYGSTLVFAMSETGKPLESVDQKSLWIKRRVSVQLDCRGAGIEAWRVPGKRGCGSSQGSSSGSGQKLFWVYLEVKPTGFNDESSMECEKKSSE